MNNVVISVENLSKSYRLGQIGTGTLTNDLKVWWAKLHGKPNPLLKIGQPDVSNQDGETVWALKDVSFQVEQGEVLGIIGRNGAGKSTLLKILSRVTAPTSGQVKVKGRIASLLEVGTGFHPELTGRENIYLNGAILGMSKEEVRRKFDEIVAFAEVEKFVDTPVKRYSSGMYVRLAFAVAAHLESEILLVDEVLAVGDSEFQKKCLGKMGDVASKEGRTVFFVSHNMNMILRLCQSIILLHNGRLEAQGIPEAVVKHYLAQESFSPSERIWKDKKDAPGDSVAKLHLVRVCDENGEVAEKIDIQKQFYIELRYWNLQRELKPTGILHFIDQQGITLFATCDWSDDVWWNTQKEPGLVIARCHIPGNFLAEGTHSILAAIGTYNPNVVHALARDVVSFVVVDTTTGEGVRGEYSGGTWPGVIRPKMRWSVMLGKEED